MLHSHCTLLIHCSDHIIFFFLMWLISDSNVNWLHSWSDLHMKVNTEATEVKVVWILILLQTCIWFRTTYGRAQSRIKKIRFMFRCSHCYEKQIFESHMSKNFAQRIWTTFACSLTYEQILITIANTYPIHSKQKSWLNLICIVEFPSICNQL